MQVIIGPNGSGKSALANVLKGNPKYRVTSGTVKFMNKNTAGWAVDERARMGMCIPFSIFRKFQGSDSGAFSY